MRCAWNYLVACNHSGLYLCKPIAILFIKFQPLWWTIMVVGKWCLRNLGFRVMWVMHGAPQVKSIWSTAGNPTLRSNPNIDTLSWVSSKDQAVQSTKQNNTSVFGLVLYTGLPIATPILNVMPLFKQLPFKLNRLRSQREKNLCASTR